MTKEPTDLERYREWTQAWIAEREAAYPNAPKQTPPPLPPGAPRIRAPRRATDAKAPASAATGRIRARARETYKGVRGRSDLRAQRVALVALLTARGMSSPQIAKQLGIAASTVRDYRADPDRGLARARQAQLGVMGIVLNGTPVGRVRPVWRRGGPHKGQGTPNALARGRQLQAVVGYYAKRPR